MLILNAWKFVNSISENTLCYNSSWNPPICSFLCFTALEERTTTRRSTAPHLDSSFYHTYLHTPASRPRQSLCSLTNIPRSFQPSCVNIMFLPATGFLTNSDVKAAHLNRQMELSIFSNCFTCTNHTNITEKNFLKKIII